jgi:hypothetical protein
MGYIERIPKLEPLENDKKIHVSEEKTKEENLRNELEDNLHGSLEIYSIIAFKNNSNQHMDNGDDD